MSSTISKEQIAQLVAKPDPRFSEALGSRLLASRSLK